MTDFLMKKWPQLLFAITMAFILTYDQVLGLVLIALAAVVSLSIYPIVEWAKAMGSKKGFALVPAVALVLGALAFLESTLVSGAEVGIYQFAAIVAFVVAVATFWWLYLMATSDDSDGGTKDDEIPAVLRTQFRPVAAHAT